MLTPPARVGIICVNYFTEKAVIAYGRSLMEGPNSAFLSHFIVVDNGSNDTAKLSDFRLEDERVRIARPPENLGYYNGAEFGRRLFAEELQDCAWVGVTNADLTFSPEALSELCAIPDGGRMVVAPDLISPEGGHLNPFMRERPSKLALRIRGLLFGSILAGPVRRLLRFRRRLKLRRRPPYDASSRQPPIPVFAGHGACLFFGRMYFSKGGDFLHPTFLYGEEIVVGERVRRMGSAVWFHPEIEVRHEGGLSTRSVPKAAMARIQWEASRKTIRFVYE